MTAKHVEFVKRQLRKAMESCIDKLNDEQTRNTVIHAIIDVLSGVSGVRTDKISLGVTTDPVDDTKVDLEAKNLYTLLLLNGIFIPYELVENQDEYIHKGVLYEYDPIEQVGRARLI